MDWNVGLGERVVGCFLFGHERKKGAQEAYGAENAVYCPGNGSGGRLRFGWEGGRVGREFRASAWGEWE